MITDVYDNILWYYMRNMAGFIIYYNICIYYMYMLLVPAEGCFLTKPWNGMIPMNDLARFFLRFFAGRLLLKVPEESHSDVLQSAPKKWCSYSHNKPHHTMILMVCTVLKFILPMKMLNLGMDRMVKLVALRTFSRSFFSDRSCGQTYPRVMHSSSRLQV